MIQTCLQPLDEATRLEFAGTWDDWADDVGARLQIPEETWERAEREQQAIYG